MLSHPIARRPRAGDWVPAWALATVVLAGFTVYSAASVTHGFVAYYAASRLLTDGSLGPSAYDDAWFGAYVQRLTGTAVREIFTPNPPTMALMAWPIARFDHGMARAVWLFGSVALFAAAVYALARARPGDGRVPLAPLLLAMLAPAVFTNIRIGQGYLILFALLAFAVVWVERGRQPWETAGGAVLGLALGLKISGTALVLILAARRRWRPIAAAAAVALALAAAVTPFIDSAAWWLYPDAVGAFVQRPSGSVTAYQTTLSLFRRLCIADPAWNPAPAASCANIAFAVPYTLIGAAAVVTAVAAHRGDTRAALAAGVVLTLLAQPAAAEVHSVLLGIPLLILALGPIELAVLAFLLIVPLEVTAERFTTGWSILFAYPRLYAAWLLWAASIRELLGSPTREPRVLGRITSSLQLKAS